MTASNLFQYELSKLTKCAEQQSSLARSNNTLLSSLGPECQSLFQEHQSFYKRSSAHSNTAKRYDQFIDSVIFVHHHNQKHASFLSSSTATATATAGLSHRVTLNQFSDLFDHELPFPRTLAAKLKLPDNLKNTLKSTLEEHFSRKNKNQEMMVHEITKKHHYLLGQTKSNSSSSSSFSFAYDLVTSNDNWNTNLNWATKDNPDGVKIVHESMDQGTCGSCWAFAATGSLEANAARNAAMRVFFNELPPEIQLMSSSWKHNDTTIAKAQIHNAVPQNKINQAIQIAQSVENKAIMVAKLSVQQLIDCDTKRDQGCVGGNPVMAFPYIHKHGLVSSTEYPYEGIQNRQCMKDNLLKAIATSDSWGILKSKYEAGMEFALRHLGPISIGFNGADEAFLSYSGGIYDSNVCTKHPNHAMLITGYGEEKDSDGELVKYWIARNSWGTGWGENGYIKIRRKYKSNGSSGVCGIARNPSMAIDGYLIGIDNYATKWVKEHINLVQINDHSLGKGLFHTKHQSFSSPRLHLYSNCQQFIQTSSTVQLCAISLVGFAFIILLRVYTVRSRNKPTDHTRREPENFSGNHLAEQMQLSPNVTDEIYYGSIS